ncbi:MAG: ABC transporter permease [Verrucomicrobiaceae bacterium]|nr:ABC transporter permease [Verrucomicrobiaceae bacterium]
MPTLLLAVRYITRHRVQSLLLATALGLVFALPLCLRVLVRHAQADLRARAASTPQIVGVKGSALDLMMTALYFKRESSPSLPLATLAEIRATGTAQAIPLHVRFHAQESPIVGTELDYFTFRGLKLAAGRQITRLGDCVLGARVAAKRGLKPGDALFSSSEQAFDIAGIYPLKMRITGLFAETGTADDEAIFVDLKTAWLIEGRSHGHDDVAKNAQTVLKQENDGNTVANAAVRMFQEVTDANLSTFHFHGDSGTYPVSAAIVLPADAKAEALLAGQYARSKTSQLIRPQDDMESLLTQLVRLEGFATTMLLTTAGAALFVAALVFALSFRLRRREFGTLADIGVAENSLRLVKALEITLIALLASLIAAGLYFAASIAAPALLRLAL